MKALETKTKIIHGTFKVPAEVATHLIKIERELAALKEEVHLARKEWVGDDFGHLPLSEALGKVREDMDKRADEAVDSEHIAKLKRDNARLNDLLNPRTWTLEMSTAWHKNIPNVHAAFAALRSLSNV